MQVEFQMWVLRLLMWRTWRIQQQSRRNYRKVMAVSPFQQPVLFSVLF